MVHTPDIIIPQTDGAFSFLGAEFQILHTPGHSAGHICVVTPDNVCYAADALLSREMLNAKLPYSLCHKQAIASREKLRGLSCDGYILAHRGVCAAGEFETLIDENQALVERRAEEIFRLVSEPMTASQITEAVCAEYELFTKQPRRSVRFERNIRFFLDYLVDTRRLELVCRRGVTLYVPADACTKKADVL
jgi:glyoxylase-like metal-dependent hydrolase (beta-lactamase superfamily II)